jgi:hypothetical protein
MFHYKKCWPAMCMLHTNFSLAKRNLIWSCLGQESLADLKGLWQICFMWLWSSFFLTLFHEVWFQCYHTRGGDVRLDGQKVFKKDTFYYLGSMLQKNRDIDKDISHRIKADGLKWHQASDVLCDFRVPLKLKDKCYKITIWSVILYKAECWSTKRRHI